MSAINLDKDNIRETKIVLETSKDGIPPNDISNSGKVQAELEKIRSASVSALKIITISSIVHDEISEDFLSNFGNYSIIVEKMKSFSLIDDNFPHDEDSFLKNPMDCWMKVVVTLFVTLYSLPNHGNITCDVITSTTSSNGKNIGFSSLGIYFSTVLKLESYDWKMHRVELFVPNENGDRMIFIIDEEPVMYTIV